MLLDTSRVSIRHALTVSKPPTAYGALGKWRLTDSRVVSSMAGQTGELGVAKLRGEPWVVAPSADPRAFDSQT